MFIKKLLNIGGGLKRGFARVKPGKDSWNEKRIIQDKIFMGKKE
jgi:hypothetical protein